MELGAYARIAIKGAHPNGHLRAIWPGSSEEACSAHRAKGFDRALALAIDTDELATFEQAELLTPNTHLRKTKCAGVFSTARAMAMASANEGVFFFKVTAATETTTCDERGHDPLRK